MTIDFDRITHPLRLAVGSHELGSGTGCAMNVVSYINGDTQITDFPACSAKPLAIAVQLVNDYLGAEYGERGGIVGDAGRLLRPVDAIRVIDLGVETMGTRTGAHDTTFPEGWLTEQLRALAGMVRNSVVAWNIRHLADHPETYAGGHEQKMAAHRMADTFPYTGDDSIDRKVAVRLEGILDDSETPAAHDLATLTVSLQWRIMGQADYIEPDDAVAWCRGIIDSWRRHRPAADVDITADSIDTALDAINKVVR